MGCFREYAVCQSLCTGHVIGHAYIITALCLLLWLLCRAVLSGGEPLQDLVLDASGDFVCVSYFEHSSSSEEDDSDLCDSGCTSSCTVLCAPVYMQEKEDWDAV